MFFNHQHWKKLIKEHTFYNFKTELNFPCWSWATTPNGISDPGFPRNELTNVIISGDCRLQGHEVCLWSPSPNLCSYHHQ